MLVYVFCFDKKLGASLANLFKADKLLMGDYFKHCKFFLIVAALFGTSTALQTVILGHLTDAAIAANAASNSIFQILKVASIGASASAAVMIGKAIATGDKSVVKSYTQTLQIIFLCIGACTSTALFFLRAPVLSLYGNLSPEAHDLARLFILVLCVTGFGTAYEMPSLCGIVRSGGDSKFVFYNDLIQYLRHHAAVIVSCGVRVQMASGRRCPLSQFRSDFQVRCGIFQNKQLHVASQADARMNNRAHSHKKRPALLTNG